VAKIATEAEGFVYCVSSLGTTGVRSEFAANLDSFLDHVKANSPVPIAVGFGVSTKEQVQQMQTKADGVIVGSALVKRVMELEHELVGEGKQTALTSLQQFVNALLSK
jgi:tryptophan synthase alpha chain